MSVRGGEGQAAAAAGGGGAPSLWKKVAVAVRKGDRALKSDERYVGDSSDLSVGQYKPLSSLYSRTSVKTTNS